MADENEIASSYEQSERDVALKGHAQLMARIKPSDDCRHCGETLRTHRQQWGSCIDCATKIEQIGQRFAR